jgi:hypothetical protein
MTLITRLTALAVITLNANCLRIESKSGFASDITEWMSSQVPFSTFALLNNVSPKDPDAKRGTVVAPTSKV